MLEHLAAGKAAVALVGRQLVYLVQLLDKALLVALREPVEAGVAAQRALLVLDGLAAMFIEPCAEMSRRCCLVRDSGSVDIGPVGIVLVGVAGCRISGPLRIGIRRCAVGGGAIGHRGITRALDLIALIVRLITGLRPDVVLRRGPGLRVLRPELGLALRPDCRGWA